MLLAVLMWHEGTCSNKIQNTTSLSDPGAPDIKTAIIRTIVGLPCILEDEINVYLPASF